MFLFSKESTHFLLNTKSFALCRVYVSSERITGKETFEKYAANAFPDNIIDFLLFSKVGCELHAKNLFADSNVYYELLSAYKNKLSQSGLAAIIDVTTKADGREYMPIVLNRGITRFTSSNAGYSTLSPISCNKYESNCGHSCFCQQEILW